MHGGGRHAQRPAPCRDMPCRIPLGRFSPCPTVLDVGCGSGDNLEALAATGSYELAGVDVADAALDVARARVPCATLSVLEIQRDVLPRTSTWS